MTVKEREQKPLLREYKKKYGSRDVNDVLNRVEESISEKRDEIDDLESDIWHLEEELDDLKKVKNATCEIKKPMAKHTARPKTERKLSMFFGE
jgi:predicted  nucleic acid-binding Zn-ribbon protein